jgi:spore photoproduct lyase
MALLSSQPTAEPVGAERLWRPKRVLITPAARGFAHGRAIAERAAAAGIEVVELPGDRLTGLKHDDPRRAYIEAKGTLAVVVAPPGKRRLQPIPPSADWRFDLAEGCPAHCHYCYLAGSLKGPPVTRVYANLDEILAGLEAGLGRGRITSKDPTRAKEGTTFEASCYTDPLGIEHLTGSLSAAIRHFSAWEAATELRFTTKFDAVAPLLDMAHGGRTRMRASVNARPTLRFEGGTAPLDRRLAALSRMGRAGYRVGLTVAPIMGVEGWREAYDELLASAGRALVGIPGLDLTVECITHRFTAPSRAVLSGWYPGTSLAMEPSTRAEKRTKFGTVKYVYPTGTMRELRRFFEEALGRHLPGARLLYWT